MRFISKLMRPTNLLIVVTLLMTCANGSDRPSIIARMFGKKHKTAPRANDPASVVEEILRDRSSSSWAYSDVYDGFYEKNSNTDEIRTVQMPEMEILHENSVAKFEGPPAKRESTFEEDMVRWSRASKRASERNSYMERRRRERKSQRKSQPQQSLTTQLKEKFTCKYADKSPVDLIIMIIDKAQSVNSKINSIRSNCINIAVQTLSEKASEATKQAIKQSIMKSCSTDNKQSDDNGINLSMSDDLLVAAGKFLKVAFCSGISLVTKSMKVIMNNITEQNLDEMLEAICQMSKHGHGLMKSLIKLMQKLQKMMQSDISSGSGRSNDGVIKSWCKKFAKNLTKATLISADKALEKAIKMMDDILDRDEFKGTATNWSSSIPAMVSGALSGVFGENAKPVADVVGVGAFAIAKPHKFAKEIVSKAEGLLRSKAKENNMNVSATASIGLRHGKGFFSRLFQ